MDGHTDGHRDEHMDGHRDEHLDGHVDGHMGGHMDGHMDEHMDGHTDERRDEHMDGHTDGHMDELMDGHMDGPMGGHMDGAAQTLPKPKIMDNIYKLERTDTEMRAINTLIGDGNWKEAYKKRHQSPKIAEGLPCDTEGTWTGNGITPRDRVGTLRMPGGSSLPNTFKSKLTNRKEKVSLMEITQDEWEITQDLGLELGHESGNAVPWTCVTFGGCPKSLGRSADTKEGGMEMVWEQAWAQKDCASSNRWRVTSTETKDCIESGAQGTTNRGIRPLLESSTAKADPVSSGPTPTSNRMEIDQAPDIKLSEEQVSSMDRGRECGPPKDLHKRPEADNLRGFSQRQNCERKMRIGPSCKAPGIQLDKEGSGYPGTKFQEHIMEQNKCEELEPDFSRNQVEARWITSEQLGRKRIQYGTAGGGIHETSTKRGRAQKPTNQEKARNSPHTLHEKIKQVKGNANLITANDAARLQEQHGRVCGTSQQKNGGDDGWIRLKTGTDNEAAGNEDLEDGAKNLAKERPRNLSGQEPPNNPLHDSLKVVRLGIQAELGIKMSTLKLEEKSHGKQVKDKTNNKNSQETFNPEDDEELPKETSTVLKFQMKLFTKFQEGWCNRMDARTEANNKCPCLIISLARQPWCP